MRSRLALAWLCLQVAWFSWEQRGPSRYFCWAPLHEHVWYRIDAQVAGRSLSQDEIRARYERPGAFLDAKRVEQWELNAAAHIIDSIRLREAQEPPAGRAEVVLSYRRNAGESETWRYRP